MIPILQRPADLQLAVSRTADLGSLTILQSDTIWWEDYEITFNVLGESHEAILRYYGQVVLHELLSCARVSHGTTTHVHNFDDEQAHSYEQEGYRIDVTMSDLTPGAGIAPTTPNLLVEFPKTMEDGSIPFTSIQWEVRDDILTWRTIHLYVLPDREVAVFSTSRWQPPEEGIDGQIGPAQMKKGGAR